MSAWPVQGPGFPSTSSSHFILSTLSSQSDRVRVSPRSRAALVFCMPHVSPSALQEASVAELPAGSLEWETTLPSCMKTRLISCSWPASVPSVVRNCVTTVMGLDVSTAKPAPLPKNFSPSRRELKPQPLASHWPTHCGPEHTNCASFLHGCILNDEAMLFASHTSISAQQCPNFPVCSAAFHSSMLALPPRNVLSFGHCASQ
mmetsp:Transcript_116103/g.329051  ORF Transcript_116103/g.329051 Transcript_116103/m.329051 type:complete len:203 (+) Transcript_116103:236-844(+)